MAIRPPIEVLEQDHTKGDNAGLKSEIRECHRMVLQVFSNFRQVQNDRNSQFFEERPVPDAGQLENLRRLDRSYWLFSIT